MKKKYYIIYKYVLRKYGKHILKKYHKQLFGLICYFFRNNIIFIILTSFYYGFLNFLFIGPSYFYIIYFLTGSKITDEVKIPASIGFLVGRCIIIISTLYTPFYRLFNKPHCITIFMVLILVWHWLKLKDQKFYFNEDDLDKKKLILLTNLVFQILNYFIVPNSALLRSMNVFIFKCNNKKVFLLFNLVGSLIGYYVFIIIINLIDKFLLINLIDKSLLKIKNLLTRNKKFKIEIITGPYIYKRIFNSLFYLTYLIILGKMPFIFSQKSYDIQDELDLDKMTMDKKKEDELTELINEKKNDYESKPLLQVFFDYQGWVQPYRYIKNRNADNFLRKEMSQYFFNGYNEEYKFNIFYTYSPNLYNFLKLINETFSLTDLNNIYIDDNKLDFKRWNFKDEFYDRINILNQIIYDNDDDDDEQIFKYSDSIETKFRFFDYVEIEENKKKIFKKLSLNYKKLNEDEILTSVSFLFEHIKDLHKFFTEYNYEDLHKFFTEYKYVSKWFYNLISEVRFMEHGWNYQPGVRSRRFKRVLIYKEDEKEENIEAVTNKKKHKKDKKQIDKEKELQKEKEKDQSRDLVFMRYFTKSDFRKNLIKGSMRTKRRKTRVYHSFQKDLTSALFVDKRKIKVFQLFFNYLKSFRIGKKKSLDEIIINNIGQIEQISVKDAELWDILPLLHGFRGMLLIIHSFLRKHITLPFLIVTKNIGRILLFQYPEFDEDFKDFRKETHIICTFNGVQLSEKEFPKQWGTEGMQIKILYPFKLRPWRSHKNKEQKPCFLTFFGKETDIPFGPPIKKSSFFKPIIKYMRKYYILDLIIRIIKMEIFKKKKKSDLEKVEEEQENILVLNDIDILDDELLYKIKEKEEIKEKIIMIEKLTSKKILTNTNLKLLKSKVKRIISKDYLFSFFVLKFHKIIVLKFHKMNNIIKNIIMFLDKIIISTLKNYIEKNENNEFILSKFILSNIKNNNKFISQAYVFYKILQQTNNKTLCNTWKDLLNINKVNIKNIPQYYNSKMYKIYEYLYFSLNYLNKNDNYLIKQEKLINFCNNLYSLNKKTYDEYGIFNNENNIINTEYEFKNWIKHSEQYMLSLNYIFDIIKKENNNVDTKDKKDKIEDIKQNNIKGVDTSHKILNDDDENISKIYYEIPNDDDENISKTSYKVKVHNDDKKISKSIIKKKISEEYEDEISKDKDDKEDEIDENKEYEDEDEIIKIKVKDKEDEVNKEIIQQIKRDQKIAKNKKKHFKNLFQLEWCNSSINKKILNNIRSYSRFVRLIKAKKFEIDPMFFVSELEKGNIELSILPLINKKLGKLIDFNIVNYNCVPLKKHNIYEKYIFIQQLIAVSFTKEFTNKDILGLCFIPENLLSSIHCKKWRILTNLNLYNNLSSYKEENFNEYEYEFNFNEYEFNYELFDLFDLYNNEYMYYNSKEICKFKKYLWPNFMLEDIACINRYWFNTNNGSRFNILRLKMHINSSSIIK
uniref:hypothetical protein RF1 n=1 Tax=Hydnora triceps TaxID=2952647 RepID=UPI00211489BE|nr:hypothetical protein RF1 [Hydnora triceps]USN93677.1 hypothetical protein RF1 [Hydnora triceps]